MNTSEPTVRIELTEQERQSAKEETDKEIVLDTNVEELEQRVAPSLASKCTTGSHFPTITITA